MAKKKAQQYVSSPVGTDRGSILPEGIHVLTVVDWDEKMGGSGFPYWAFTCVVEGGKWDGTTLWTNLSHSDKARFKMDEWLDAFQIPPGKQVHAEEFLGRQFRAKIVHGEFSGRKRPEIESYLVLSDKSGKKRATHAEVKEQLSELSAEEGDSDPEANTNEGLPEDVKSPRPKKKPF